MDLFGLRQLPVASGTCANFSVKNDDSLVKMPEGGDASTNIAHVPNSTKLDIRRSKESENYAKDLFPKTQMSQCPLLRLSNKLSSSVIDTALYSHVGLVERGVLGFQTQADFLSLEGSGFPYYRSYKSCGGFQDIVLVKDAGISCTLLDPGKKDSKTSGRSATLLEAFLLNQLKMECSDISEITRKISSYTKDILQSLSLRKKRNDKISIHDLRLPREESNSSSKQPVAMQYIDKTGRPCLKLRLVKSTELFTPVDSRQNSWWSLTVPRKDRKLMKTTNEIVGKKLSHKTRKVTDQRDELMTERAELLMENKKWNESCEIPRPRNQNRKLKQVRQLYPEEPATAELESSTCSSSSIYDFLMMRTRRTLVKSTVKKKECSRLRIHGSPNDRSVIPEPSDKHRPRKGAATKVAYGPIDSCRDSANAVCEGDTIVVNVKNHLPSDSITIHWHGLGQIGTPHMDGVPFLTQCPIHAGNSFLYNFTASPSGTHFWHSHSGFQEDDGFHGGLIIREANDINAHLYDEDLAEHVMLIYHWFQTPSAHGVYAAMFTNTFALGYSLTINGLAATAAFEKDGVESYTPRANFTVKQGTRYRFRTIANMGLYCPIQVCIDNHKLLMIASDGASFKPVEVESLIINAGERYDFVLTADQEPRSYWIRLRGLGLCAMHTTYVSSLAVLHYEGASTDDPTESTEYDDANRSGMLLNPVTELMDDYSENELIRLTDLVNTKKHTYDVSGTPDHTYYIPISVNKYNDYQVPGPHAQINGVSWVNLPFPFLTQHEQIKEDMYCTPNNDTAKHCVDSYCTCPYIYEVTLNSLVELFLIDSSKSTTDDHPMHFHGHYLHVVASQAGTRPMTVDEVKELNEAGKIERNLETAVLKDAVGVPAGGFLAVRFIADNPGYWFMHCHVASHLEEGMAIVIKTGEHSDMPQPPPDFPTCSGNWNV